MTDFVDFEAIDDNDNYDNNPEAELNANVSDVALISDRNKFYESAETYYALM